MSDVRRFLPVLTILLLPLLAACGWRSQPTYHGTYIEPPIENDEFALMSASGPVTLESLQGKWVPMFFGYTNCPDVCPMTMSVLKKAVATLDSDQRDDVQVLFVSVDPDRDPAHRLAAYTAGFDSSFIGATGTSEEIDRMAASLGIHHEKQEGTVESGYLVDHTASVLLLDPHGRTRMSWPYGTSAEEIAADLQTLLN